MAEYFADLGAVFVYMGIGLVMVGSLITVLAKLA